MGNFGSLDGDPPAAMRYTGSVHGGVAGDGIDGGPQGRHGRFHSEL